MRGRSNGNNATDPPCSLERQLVHVCAHVGDSEYRESNDCWRGGFGHCERMVARNMCRFRRMQHLGMMKKSASSALRLSDTVQQAPFAVKTLSIRREKGDRQHRGTDWTDTEPKTRNEYLRMPESSTLKFGETLRGIKPRVLERG